MNRMLIEMPYFNKYMYISFIMYTFKMKHINYILPCFGESLTPETEKLTINLHKIRSISIKFTTKYNYINKEIATCLFVHPCRFSIPCAIVF